jgi:hypothetical protein
VVLDDLQIDQVTVLFHNADIAASNALEIVIAMNPA